MATSNARAVVFIDAEGRLTVEPRHALQDRTGRWLVVPSPPGLMLLQPEDSPTEETVVLAGIVRPPNGPVDVLSFLLSAGWRGELRLLDGSRRRSVFVESGIVRGASSDDPADRLGEILFRRGVLTAEQLKTAVGRMGDKRIGEVLVDMGACTPQDLFGHLTQQVREIVFGTLLQRQGFFYMLTDFQATQVPAHVHLSGQELLMEGVRRIDEMAYFRQRIAHDGVVPTPRAPRPAAKLSAADEKVLDLCDGRRDLGAIARESGLGEFDATKSLAHLLQSAFVELRDHPVGDERSTLDGYALLVGSFNEILGEIHQTVAAAGRGEKTRELLVQYLGAGGIAENALQGVLPSDAGKLDAARIVSNLSRLPSAQRGQLLSYALNEYLCFALFAAGAVLRREDEQRLLGRVNQLLREVHA